MLQEPIRMNSFPKMEAKQICLRNQPWFWLPPSNLSDSLKAYSSASPSQTLPSLASPGNQAEALPPAQRTFIESESLDCRTNSQDFHDPNFIIIYIVVL